MIKLCITCATGLESILKKEIEIAGYKNIISGNKIVYCEGDDTAIAKINLRSRVGNKVFLELKQQKISDFNELFDLVFTIDWKIYIQNNPIIVTASSKQSILESTPTIQSITKKAIIKKLLDGKEGRVGEDKNLQAIEIFVYIENNICSILLNTTGESLHKRGYKKFIGEAPINESLAAGLLLLSGRKFSEPLYDFFCGSGTIVIEAALLAKNIAPGSFRKFAFQKFNRYDQTLFTKELAQAKAKVFLEKKHTIIASDIDKQMITIAQENAQNAGVQNYISFSQKDISEYIDGHELAGTMVSNPPYGIRMNVYNLENLYYTINKVFTNHPKLHGGIITSYEKFIPQNIGGTWKKSMFMNGGERCWFYKKILIK